MIKIPAIALNAISKTVSKAMQLGIKPLILLLAAVIAICLSFALLYWTELKHFEELDRLGAERLELYASTVQLAQKRFDYLPFIVAGDQQVKNLLLNKGGKSTR